MSRVHQLVVINLSQIAWDMECHLDETWRSLNEAGIEDPDTLLADGKAALEIVQGMARDYHAHHLLGKPVVPMLPFTGEVAP